MASFTEPFDSVAAWDFGSGPLTEFFVAGSSPAPYQGSSRASCRHYVDDWAVARFDVDDGGNTAILYWISYAFYMGTWADVSGTGFGNIVMPGFINLNDDPMKGLNGTDGVWGYQPFLDPSGPGGVIASPFGGANGPSGQVSENQWHTVRYALRLDGASSREILYLDGALQWDETFNSGDSNGVAGVFNGGFQDVDSYILPIDSMLYQADTDPGEPTENADLCGADLEVQVFIDGVDVTGYCIAGSWTPRLNRPAQAQVQTPMDAGIAGDCGSLLKIVLTDGTDDNIVFHGTILNVEANSDKDDGRVVYNAQDAMELWQRRPVRDDGADFSKPVVITDYQTGPQILQAMLINTVDSTGRTNGEGETGGPPPTDAEGPIGLDLGSFETGGANLSGAPTDWPMTIMELFSLLVSTGRLDAVIDYTDPGGGVTGTINGYNGDYGTDRTADVVFSYGMGDYNIASLRWNRDMTNTINKYWLYGGPRINSAADPQGDQHWCFNVTGFDKSFNPNGVASGAWAGSTNYNEDDVVTNGGFSFIARQDHTSSAANEPGVGASWRTYWFYWMAPPGGQAVDTSNNPLGPPWTDNELGERIYNSRQAYGVRMQVDIFDGYDDDCVIGIGNPGRDLYKRQWQTFSWFSAEPREIIHITPTPDTLIGCFGIGDLITVQAVADVRGGFSGAQRVYQYTVSWDGTPSVLTMGEIQTSADNEQ